MLQNCIDDFKYWYWDLGESLKIQTQGLSLPKKTNYYSLAILQIQQADVCKSMYSNFRNYATPQFLP